MLLSTLCFKQTQPLTSTSLHHIQTSYIHQLCWVNNTYYYPDHMEDADKFVNQNDKYGIHYYQFVLFILSGQIMLFYLPSVLWKIVSSDSGSYINKMLDSVDRSIFELFLYKTVSFVSCFFRLFYETLCVKIQ